MRKIINWFICLAVAATLATTLGCQPPAPPVLEKQSDEIQSQGGSSQSKIWPFVSDKQKDSALAGNLLTKNFVVILDGSGSMNDSGCSDGERKISVAKKAIVEWAKTIPSGSNLGLVTFHGRWTTLDLMPNEQARSFTDANKDFACLFVCESSF